MTLREEIKTAFPFMNNRQRRKLERINMQPDQNGKLVPTNTFGFFLVWNPEGRAPVKRHATLAIAQGEAERLAASCPAHSFYVLSAHSVARGVNTVTSEAVHYPASALRTRAELEAEFADRPF